MRRFRGTFFQIRIYDNRVEFAKGWVPFRQRVTIPYQQLAAVEITRFTRQLQLTTATGKRYRFGFWVPGKARRIQRAIAEMM